MIALPTARNAMTDWRLVLHPETDLLQAIRDLVSRRAAGAPVIREDGTLVGVLTEKDCLRVLANRAYGEVHGGTVREVMSTIKAEVTPEMDLFAVAHVFLESNFPVLPVTQQGKLVGRISRQDMLREVQRFIREQRRVKSEAAQPQGRTGIADMQRIAADASPAQLAELMRNRE
jgi:predicted transcriptional regulator